MAASLGDEVEPVALKRRDHLPPGFGTSFRVGAANRDRERSFPYEQCAAFRASGLLGPMVPGGQLGGGPGDRTGGRRGAGDQVERAHQAASHPVGAAATARSSVGIGSSSRSPAATIRRAAAPQWSRISVIPIASHSNE
jgi:hypothetical protein